MKKLGEYILENQELDKITSSNSNAKRRRLLKNYLKGRYDDYIDKLEDMTKDPKARALLDDAFGGELGDVDLDFSEEVISVKRLMPTQNEVCLESSLKHGLTQPENIDKEYEDVVEIKHPIITFNKTYVIDGHHRWSEILILNPDAKVRCINYDGDLSVIQMLKATQGAIAAAVDYIPISTPKGDNIYKCSSTKIRHYIEDNIIDDVVDKLINYNKSLNDKRDVIDFLVKNCEELVNNHPLLYNAPPRSIMPQTSKGGGLSKDGALTKMKDGDVLKI